MEMQHLPRSPSNKRINIALVLFLVIIAFFFFMEHRAHLLAFLPFVLLLACPIIHLWMHRGHGDRGGEGGYPGDEK